MAVPNRIQHTFRRDTTPSLVALGQVLKDRRLQFLNISVLLLHASLTALFLTIPNLMIQDYGIPLAQHSWIYLAVMGFAFVGMVPLVIVAESKGRMKEVLMFVTLLMSISTLFMQWANYIWVLGILLWLYFIAFNTLEATLPSLISKLAPVGYRGTAMGVFSTHQFMGSFLGGLVGGWLLQNYSNGAIFWAVGLLFLVWSVVCFIQPTPRQLSSLAFSVSGSDQAAITTLMAQLEHVQGVEDMQVFADEQTAYLKVDKKILDKNALRQIAPQANI